MLDNQRWYVDVKTFKIHKVVVKSFASFASRCLIIFDNKMERVVHPDMLFKSFGEAKKVILEQLIEQKMDRENELNTINALIKSVSEITESNS